VNKLRYVGSDEPLTTEQGYYVKQKAVFAARRSFVGRKLFAGVVRKIDAGTQVFGYDTLTEINNASLDFTWPGRPAEDFRDSWVITCWLVEDGNSEKLTMDCRTYSHHCGGRLFHFCHTGLHLRRSQSD